MSHERTNRPVVSVAESWMKWILLVPLCGMLALALPFPAMAQTSAREAGIVSAQIPLAKTLRGKQTLEVAKDMKVLWGDKITTERGSRVRVRLNDGSILNVGSQSSLEIQTHDTQAQRTQLQLAYGRMRASVVRITQPDGGFTVRTTAAVAGVVGTDEFIEAAQIYTTVIALGGGLVTVGSPNPLYSEFGAILNPGEAITLVADQRPGEKRLATDEELGNAFGETEVDEVVSIQPRATFPGQTFQARIVGKGIAGATGASFAREGISMQITGPMAANGLPVSITVAQNVPHGTYPFTVQRPEGPQVGVLIVTSAENARRAGAAAPGSMKAPPAQIITAMRGAKFMLDASATETPAGTSIVAFLWKILETRFSSNQAQFTVNTSLLMPGDYVIQLAVINSSGQAVTQRYSLTVQSGIQPVEIIRELAAGYESLQPNQFLKYFDEEKFRNYSGFAAAIEDSFRSQLEAVRVFQRPVNCTVSEEQDQAACQADFELQFTKKEQPTEFLDANGNPFPPGVAAPANAVAAKRLLTGTERSTIRFERADKGWKVTDYGAQVSCPGGNQVSGVNVGSCILALGSFSSPGFQFTNVLLPGGTVVPVGGALTGTFDISPLGGFNGAVTLTGTANVGGTLGTVTFSTNPASSLSTVTFTVAVPTTGPQATTPFSLIITGTDSSGSISQRITLPLTYQGAPPFSLSQFTNPTAPLTLLANSSVVIGITAVTSGTSFSTPIALTFGPLPAGVTVSPTTATVLPGSTQPFTFTFTPANNAFANFGVANITVTGTVAGVPVQTSTIVLNLGTPGSLPFSLFSSPSANTVTLFSSSKVTAFFNVFVSLASGFTQPIDISLSTPPPGITITPSTFVFTPGVSGSNVFYTVTVDPAVASPGSYPILISGVSRGISATTTFTLNVRGAFSLSVSPQNTLSTPMILPPDGTTQSKVTVTVTSINNFAGSVTVFFSNPFGTPVTVTPGTSQVVNVPAGGSANAVFTLVAAVGAANTGTTQAFISASSATGSAINSLSLPFMTIGPAGFSLSPAITSTIVNINSGFSPTVATSVRALGAFNASVDFTVVSASVPVGITVTPATQTVAAGSQASFTITAGASAVSGNYPITVNATSPGQTAQTLTINVRARGTLTLSVTTSSGGVPGTSSAPLVLASGAANALTFNVSVGSSNGFSGSSQVQVFNVPAGITAVFTSSGSTVASGTVTSAAPFSDTLTLTNNTASPISVSQLTVLASDSFNGLTNVNPTAAIFVTTGAITLNVLTVSGGVPGTSTAPLTLAPGGSLSFNVSVGSINGFSGSAQVQVFGMPSGVTAVFTSSTSSFANLPVPGSDTLTLTASQASLPFPVTQMTVRAVSLPSGTSVVTSPIFISSASTFVLGCAPFGGTAQPCNQTNYVAININQSGSTSSLVLQVDSFGGYSGTVSVVPRNLPAGMTMSPNPATLTPGVPVTVTFSAATPVVAGPFTFTLDGSDTVFPTLTSSTNVSGQLNGSIKLVVTPATSSANPLIVPPGAAQVFTVDISGQNGFSGSAQVAFSPLSSPTGVTFGPTGSQFVNVPSTGSVTLSFTVTAAANAPASSVQLVDFDAGVNVGNAFTYFVQNETLVQGSYNVGPVGVGSYLMSTTPASSSTNPIFLNPNGTAVVPVGVSIIPQSGFLGTVTITPSAPPSGVTVTPTSAQVVITSSSPGTATFSYSATTSQGPTPITVTFNAAANVTTPSGTFPVNNSTSSFLLVNPAPFSMTLSAGTPAAPISLEQGIPRGQTFQVSVTGAGTATITFANVPSGITISPLTANIPAGSSATFSIEAGASTAIGSYVIAVLGTSGTQTISASLAVNVVAPTNGFFLATSPPTSLAAPVLLQPDTTLITFINLNVLAKGTFTGLVNLALSGVPTGVTATLTPSVADLSISSVQVVQLHFQTSTGLAAFGPSVVTVTGTSGPLTASTSVFVALQIVSLIQTSGSLTTRAPEILQVLPPSGHAGSHMIVTLQGSSLSSITQVMSGSTKLSAQIEPGGTDLMRRLVIFVRPDTPEGVYTLMLVSPRGLVPVGINITTEASAETPDATGSDGRPVSQSGRFASSKAGGGGNRRGTQEDADGTGVSSQPVITRVEPASLKPGDVVVGKLVGENLSGVTAVRAAGLGISVEVLEARDTEIRVRFIVAANTASGSRMLSLLPSSSRSRGSDAMLEIQADRVATTGTKQAVAVPTLQEAPVESTETPETPTRPGIRRGLASNGGAPSSALAPATSGALDLAVRASDITMSPASPRPGDDVTFRVLLTNRGTKSADDVEVEFTVGGANVRVREHFSVAAGSSQSFQVQWQAAGTGRLEPRVVIDPDRRLNLASRTNTTAAMPAFELFSAAGAAGRAPAPMRERGQMTLTANGCQGFRFSSGTEQGCNGGADFEVRVAPQGGALRIEADGVRNLGVVALEQAAQMARGSMATAETVQPGSVYLVETRRGSVLVRVLDIRGQNAVRAAAPTAMNRPRLSDVDEQPAVKPQSNITLVLEWRPLSQ